MADDERAPQDAPELSPGDCSAVGAAYELTGIDVPAGICAAAGWWGVSRKTIQRWIKDGQENKDPCPYRQPELMVGWYGRVYSKAVFPAILEKLESLPVPASESAPEEKPAPQVPLRYSEPGGEESLVERFRTHEQALHRRYLRALEDTEIDERTRRTYREEWETAADALRLQEQSAKKTGDMLPVSAFDLAFRQFAAHLPMALVNALPAHLPRQEREAIARATLAQLPDHLEPLAA